MTNDTNNALTDFDMCLALTQKAINSQMSASWKSWIARSEFSNTGEMKDFGFVNIYDDDSKTSGVELEFDPLTVLLRGGGTTQTQVRVTLHLKSGSVFCKKTKFSSSEVEENTDNIKDLIAAAIANKEVPPLPDKKKDRVKYNLVYDPIFATYEAEYQKAHPDLYRDATPISNWEISFLTDIDKKPCDYDVLEAIDPSVRGIIKDIVAKTGLPDSVFSIEYIFMKFTEVDLLLGDPRDFKIPDGVSEAAKVNVKVCLQKMLGGTNGKFMLGTVLRRSKENSPEAVLPTFSLTDFVFNVQNNSDVPEASTLSYLGMFSKRPLPINTKDIQSLNIARTALHNDWVRPEMLDGAKGLFSGVMAISKQVFMEKYLIGALSRSLQGESLESSGLTWTFKKQEQICQKTQREVSIIPPFYINCNYNSARSYWITLAIHPGTNQISISGRIDSHAIYDGYTLDMGFLGGNDHVSWIHYEGHSDISGSVDLQGKGIGTEFKLNPIVNFVIHDTQVDKDESGGLNDVTEAMGPVFDSLGIIDGSPKDALAHQQNSIMRDMRSSLESELNNLKLDLTQHAFIPPGGGVYNFQNPRFSSAGDLLFDVIYQAVT
jgi:hypothetical protein